MPTKVIASRRDIGRRPAVVPTWRYNSYKDAKPAKTGNYFAELFLRVLCRRKMFINFATNEQRLVRVTDRRAHITSERCSLLIIFIFKLSGYDFTR